MTFDNDYYENGRGKLTRKFALRGITFLVIVVIAIFSVVILFSRKVDKLITADIALQSAKKDHKDFIVFYDELDKFQEYEKNMYWTKKLKSAFVNNNIKVFFQPIVNNKTLKVDKYECLVRLIDEDGKVIAPFFFLDISKKSNQYTKLTKIVLEKSVATNKKLFSFLFIIFYFKYISIVVFCWEAIARLCTVESDEG